MNKLEVLIKTALDKWVTTEDVQLTTNGPYYNVNKIKKYTKNLKPIDIDINKITNIDRSKKTGFSKKRYENSNLKEPIIINEKNRIIDGRHRVLKAKEQNKKIIKGYIVNNKIIESFV